MTVGAALVLKEFLHGVAPTVVSVFLGHSWKCGISFNLISLPFCLLNSVWIYKETFAFQRSQNLGSVWAVVAVARFAVSACGGWCI